MLSTFRMCIGVLALALSACAAPPPAAPTQTSVQLGITGAGDMNGGAPAQVKVYYLNDPGTFRSADFFAVFGTPEQTLGEDLIAVDTFQLAPARTVADTKTFATPPTAIGVVAAFRDIDGTFLAVKPIVPNAPNPAQVTLTGNTVTIR